MLGIRLFDQEGNAVGVLELPATPDFTVEENGPLFEDDGISSGFSVPGELPNTERNNAVLQNAHSLRRMQYFTVYNCEVLRENIPVLQGKFLLIEGTNGTVQFSIAINGFNTDVLNKNLRDFNWPIDTIYGPDNDTIDIVNHCSAKCKVVDWREKYTFPVYQNKLFYGEGSTSSNPHFEGIVNEWDDVAQLLKYNTTDGAPSSEDEFIFNKYNLVPWFYIQWILREICILEGYSIGGPALQSANFKKAVLPTNYALDKKSGLDYYVRASTGTPNVFPTPVPTLPYLMQLGFDDETTSPNEDNSSSWNPSLGRYTIKQAGYHHFYISLQFQITWANTQFVFKIKRSDGTTIHAVPITNNLNNPASQPGGVWFTLDIDTSSYAAAANIGQYYSFEIEYTVMSLLPGGPFEVLGYVQIVNTSYKELNVYSNVIDPKNHMPDITVGDLVNMLRDVYAIAIDFDRGLKKMLVSYIEEELNSAPIEITPGTNTGLDAELTLPEEYIIRYKEAIEYSFEWDFGSDATADEFKEVDRAAVLGSVETFFDLETTFTNAQVGDIAYVQQLQAYYTRQNNTTFPTVLWYFHSYAYAPYTTGEKPTVKAPICSPMVTINNRVLGMPYNRLITTIAEPGTSIAFDTGINNPSVKLAYWHGRQYGTPGYLYPMATSGNYNFAASIIVTDEDGGQFGEVTPLEWESLFLTHWRSWYQLMQNAHEVEIEALANMGFLRNIDLRKPYTLNHISYMVKTLRYRLTNYGPQPTTLILARKMPSL